MENQFNQQFVQENQQPVQPQKPVYERIDKKILKKCRHKSERRWYRFMVLLNVVIIAAVIAWFALSVNDNMKYVDDVASQAETMVMSTDEAEVAEAEEKFEETVNEIPENITYFVMIAFLIVAVPFVVSYAYAQYRSMSVRITEKTYPEIYAIVEEYAQKLGMKRVPKIYMVQGNGVLNAFSAFIPFRQYIEVYADLLEVAYREHHDMDTIRFVIGHEMAHIYYKHATMHYNYSLMLANMIPIFSQTLSRAQEYSCDRLAQLLSGSDGVDAMMTLTAGIHLYKQVDKADYIEHAKSVKGLFVFCYNLVCDHPVVTKRVLALVDPEKKSGKLY